MRPRRWMVGIIASINLGMSGFASYGLYTRAGPIQFDQGGAFGATASPKATVPAVRASAPIRARASSRGAATPRVRGNHVVARAGTTFSFPREGTYRYAGTGHEQVHYSFAPACSWDIGQVNVVFKRDGSRLIADWTYSEQRQERHIDVLRADGLYRTFVGAAVTCAGVRKTSNATYSPAALTAPIPLRAYAWKQTCETEDRTEVVRGRVLGRETISVPAGRFDTWHIRIDGSMSGGQTGSYSTDLWFAPSLGTIAQQTTTLDARSGDARFESQMTLKLASSPA